MRYLFVLFSLILSFGILAVLNINTSDQKECFVVVEKFVGAEENIYQISGKNTEIDYISKRNFEIGDTVFAK